MSVQDRDYWREPSRGGGILVGVPAKWILAVGTGIAFVAQAAVENASPEGALFIARHLALSWDGLARGEAWQVITCALLHAGVFHLFWNMSALVLLLSVLEERLLPGEVFWIYAAGVLGGSAAHALWVLAGLAPPNTVLMGASAGVTAILAAAIVIMSRTKLALFGVLSIPVWLLGVIYLGWDAIRAGLYLVDPVAFDTDVAVEAHLGGALAGAALCWRLRRAAAPAPRAVKREEAARAAREDGEAARVDALLARIHESGIGALTDEERAFLKRVSSRYRR